MTLWSLLSDAIVAPEAATTAAGMSAGYIAWMVGLSLCIFIIMSMSFRRWRSDLCSSSSPENKPEEDSSSDSTSSYTESGSVRLKGHFNPALEAGDSGNLA